MFINQGTLQLIKEYADDYCCLELLQFFGRYPSAHFNRLAIIHALNNSNNNQKVVRALDHLERDKLIDVTSEHGTTVYSLSAEKTLQYAAINIATLDLPQRRTLFKNGDVRYPEQTNLIEKKSKTVTLSGPIAYRAENPLPSVAIT